MAKSATVRVRVEPELKETAESVLSRRGLTTSEAITLFLNQVTLVGGLPFPVRLPNEETREAIDEARSNGTGKTYATVEEMTRDLLE